MGAVDISHARNPSIDAERRVIRGLPLRSGSIRTSSLPPGSGRLWEYHHAGFGGENCPVLLCLRNGVGEEPTCVRGPIVRNLPPVARPSNWLHHRCTIRQRGHRVDIHRGDSRGSTAQPREGRTRLPQAAADFESSGSAVGFWMFQDPKRPSLYSIRSRLRGEGAIGPDRENGGAIDPGKRGREPRVEPRLAAVVGGSLACTSMSGRGLGLSNVLR